MDNHQWICSLVEKHEKPLCRYAYSLTGSISAAQDAVQETFLRLCKGNRNRIEGHEAAWLFRVCRSRVLDMLKKEKPVQSLSPKDESAMADPMPSPAETAMRTDAEKRIPTMMRKLPERQSEVIRLKFQQGLSYGKLPMS